MKKKINQYFIFITTIAILSCIFLSLWVSYDNIQDLVMEELKSYAHMLKNVHAQTDITWAEFESTDEELRVTVVSEDGNVVYDSVVNAIGMDNHANREEIQKAWEKGEGYAIRKSDTLLKNLFYYAVRTTDGYVVRVAKEANNVWGLLERITPMMLLIIAILILLCTVLSHFTTKRIVAPISNVAMHLDDLEPVEIYEELVPFVTTIRKQHENILKNATMRQDFTANVTHELKTPLTSISGYAELMENNLVDEEHVVQFAKAIHQNADRLLTLINDIIRLSELDSGHDIPEFSSVDLYQIAIECTQMLEVHAKKHQVRISAEGKEMLVHGNKQMLEELVYNLCDNAIRYNKPEGFVKVQVFRSKEGVVLCVQDNGIGIPKEHQERIFERFYRVDKSRSKASGGTGLGLAIVKHIAAVHEAGLKVESIPNVGTSIRVTFKV